MRSMVIKLIGIGHNAIRYWGLFRRAFLALLSEDRASILFFTRIISTSITTPLRKKKKKKKRNTVALFRSILFFSPPNPSTIGKLKSALSVIMRLAFCGSTWSSRWDRGLSFNDETSVHQVLLITSTRLSFSCERTVQYCAVQYLHP